MALDYKYSECDISLKDYTGKLLVFIRMDCVAYEILMYA